jgi:hypothetical protein
MKFIRNNLGLLLMAALVLILLGGMLVMMAGKPPLAPATSSTTSTAAHTTKPSPVRTNATHSVTNPWPETTPTNSVLPGATPSATPEPTVTPLTCTDADREAIRAALAANVALPGVHYETNGNFPASVTIEGMVSGEVRSGQGQDYSLDLARLFYLTSQKELRWLWLAYGVQYLDGRYQTANPPDLQLWSSYAEGMAFFGPSGQGRLLHLSLSDWYVLPDGVHWENCPAWQGYTLDGFCEIGLELESFGGSEALFKTENAPEDWIAFNWVVSVRLQPPDYQTPILLELPESVSLCR